MVLKQYLPPPPNKIMFFCVLGDVGNLKKTREKSKGGDFAPNQKNVSPPPNLTKWSTSPDTGKNGGAKKFSQLKKIIYIPWTQKKNLRGQILF